MKTMERLAGAPGEPRKTADDPATTTGSTDEG